MTLAKVPTNTIHDIVEKLNTELNMRHAIFINDFMFIKYRNSLEIKCSNNSIDFWCERAIICSIKYNKIIKIETMKESYDIRERRWQ